MNVTETSSEGLSRTFEIVVPAKDLQARLDAKIEEIRPQVRLKGFRPGKVPSSHIKKVFGDSILGADVNCEAGAVIANFRNERGDRRIRIRHGDEVIDTGTERFGALVGDGARIGANAVIAPGAILAHGTVVGRLALVDQSPEA